jgi:hypothetical protein
MSDALKHGFIRFERPAIALVAVASFVFVWHAQPAGPVMYLLFTAIIAARIRLRPASGPLAVPADAYVTV